MKRLTLLASLLILSGCENFHRNSEIAWQAMHVLDAAQTVQIAKNTPCRRESNPFTQMLIGEYPEESNVYKWWAGTAIVHYVFHKWLDKKAEKINLDIAIRGVDLAHKFNTVHNNNSNGIKYNRIEGKAKAHCDRFFRAREQNSINLPVIRF